MFSKNNLMLRKVSFCHVILTVLCASNISVNDKKHKNKNQFTCNWQYHPAGFKIEGLSNMTGKRYDSGVVGNLGRIPNASLYCTYIYYISFEHKYLFQMGKKALLYENLSNPVYFSNAFV